MALVSEEMTWHALRLAPEEPGQVLRLQAFRAADPKVIIGDGGFGVWQARIPEPDNVLVLVSSGHYQAAAAGAQTFLSRIQAVTSPGPVVAVRRRAGSGPAGGGWPPARPHRPGAAG